MRWAQNNHGQFDDRLWQDKAFWVKTQKYWQELAYALKDHPAIAAYNIINEPAPEKSGKLPEHANSAVMIAWYQQQKGGSRDIVAFYNQIIAAIRMVDSKTPVMVDSGWYAAADSFAYWPTALVDPRVLYSFHMYEPYAATSAPNLKREEPYAYPGLIPFGDSHENWNKARVSRYLQQPLDWAEKHGVPFNRLVAGEFGCMRRLPGCMQYLEDVLSVLESARVHWAFYAFREDAWDGMDYELGKTRVPWAYWQAMEKNQPDLVKRHSTPEFEPIRKRLERSG